MKKILQGITKEEWLIGGAVALLFYVVFSRRKSTGGDKKSSSRMIIDDPNTRRKQIPADIEEQFKRVAGSSYDSFINDINSIGLPKEIAIRQLWTESTFSPNVMNCTISSPAGAQGIAQFMPQTWRAYGGGGNVCSISDSLKAYPRLMKVLMNQFPNRIDLVLAGYNWGSGRKLLKDAYTNNTPYEQYKGGLPNETKNYLATILQP